jgi:hypothetical protein
MKPLDEFAKLRTPALSDRLMAELERRPWLVVLDGLERVLVAYHRHDAAQLRDEAADTAADQIGKRDPCAAIRPEDGELLRRLAAATRSKILVSSRLMPQALVNRSGMPMPGVRCEILPGLRPADAEAMIRACGVGGRPQAIQAYLQTNCDCHPLVVGALAGLINNYPPHRGNFDRWMEDPRHGGALNLAALDLVQRRNHILLAAIDALAPESRQLLQTLALLQAGADFETLKAFNPHLPPEPEEVAEPQDPIHHFLWSDWDEKRRAQEKGKYQETLAQRQAYVADLAAWKSDPAVRAAPDKLANTIRDLEKRSLLQYDPNGKRYDLHPVVRGIAAGRMAGDETRKLGQKVVDYFSNQSHDPWVNAETLEDVASGLQVVRVLLHMLRYEEALRVYQGDLAAALRFNLNAYAEIQALLRPFFSNGWDGESVPLRALNLSYVLNEAALSLSTAVPDQAQRLLERKFALDIRESYTRQLGIGLQNFAIASLHANRLAEWARLLSLGRQIAETMEDDAQVFLSKLDLLMLSVECGNRKTADRLWRKIDRMGHDLARALYRPGDAEIWRTADLFYRGKLTEEFLTLAETLARGARNRQAIRELHYRRGLWYMTRNEPARAVDSLVQAIRMAREVGIEHVDCEAWLALARRRAGEDGDAHGDAERLSKAEDNAALAVAELWHALGERDRAVKHALRTHRWAVADGEPYVHRYYLDRTRALLADLGAELPKVPRYDPSKTTPYPWEQDVRAFIDRLRAKRETEEAECKTKRKADKEKSHHDEEIGE